VTSPQDYSSRGQAEQRGRAETKAGEASERLSIEVAKSRIRSLRRSAFEGPQQVRKISVLLHSDFVESVEVTDKMKRAGMVPL
jgi:hypothetical protein